MSTKTKTIIEKETTVQQSDTTTDAIRVAVMNTEIKHLSETMTRVESKFDKALTTFATNEQLTAAQKLADSKHEEQDTRINKLEDWNLWAQRIVGTVVILAILGTIIIKST